MAFSALSAAACVPSSSLRQPRIVFTTPLMEPSTPALKLSNDLDASRSLDPSPGTQPNASAAACRMVPTSDRNESMMILLA